ncbi:alpha/beta hydrolase fold domain-containing protein [Staphylococcus pasteuri]|uniref:alpha/beta hydrolase fold domain-containing protein n=1 Tax=Staphylococcus pasteuri TaxID=45972 RepID=UPI000E698A50|nr:alpha/beta hydrolase [Staphylococcus pasteuri]MEB6612889.1 alpha/beta hydrolase [Staphylococcus pasteuri]QQN54390.1 alpha/beta hydrolase [Staphylococcus pasteuri]QQT10104.1 alpha/beta hydrolase [Staphylococcus pasteuri]RIO54895.1 alpha/beta hydrolase [Staphylococcus pasteuri]RTX72388.1 alpha/beta hydrolase [Staphylococcus pasteuri]
MFKKVLAVISSTLVGSILFAKVKEQRSYRSFVQEKMMRLNGMKSTFDSVEGAKKALEKTKDETAGKYAGTEYEFNHNVSIQDYFGSLVYVVNNQGDRQQRTVLYIHGGAWFQDPLDYHFEFIDLLAETLDAKIVMPIYPKVPHRDYITTEVLLHKIYQNLLNKVDNPDQLIVMGDSAGGQIALSFAQSLNNKSLPQPGHIVLLSPVLDATFSNPETKKYEQLDPMLGIEGSKYLAGLWAGDTPLDDYRISPINGDMNHLGHLTIVIGTKETLYPDALKLSKMLDQKGIEHEFIQGDNLFHIYPIFPLPEREDVLNQLKQIIKKK